MPFSNFVKVVLAVLPLFPLANLALFSCRLPLHRAFPLARLRCGFALALALRCFLADLPRAPLNAQKIFAEIRVSLSRILFSIRSRA